MPEPGLSAAGALLIGLFLLALARATLLVVTVLANSMTPTLQHGDRVLVWRYWPARWLRKGQIVLVRPGLVTAARASALDNPKLTPFIKRIIGLPGERLLTPPDDGAVPAAPATRPAQTAQGQRVWDVPPGHIFVQGDNLAASLDSRSWGPIPTHSVRGVVLLRLGRTAASAPAGPHASLTSTPGLQTGQIAPAFTAETLHGAPVTLASYAGRAVAFVFITPSELCRAVIPDYEALRPHAARAGVELVLVSVGALVQTRLFMDGAGISLPVLLAPRSTNPFMDDYQARGTPAYCLVDAAGRVQSAGYPSLEWGEWQALAALWRAGCPA